MQLDGKTGPFVLHPKLRVREYRHALLVGLFALALGGLMLFSGGYLLWNADQVSRTWRAGVPAPRCRLLKMTSERQLVAGVKTDVAYELANGQRYVTHAEFYRVLVTPEPEDALEVHYLRDAPAQAVTSWQLDSLLHEVALALVALAFAGFIGWICARDIRRALRRVRFAEELAREGKLARVKLVGSTVDTKGFMATTHYRYETDKGVLLEDAISVSEGGAFKLPDDPGSSLALLSYDQRRGLLLTRGGYPLAKQTFESAPGQRGDGVRS